MAIYELPANILTLSVIIGFIDFLNTRDLLAYICLTSDISEI